MNRKHLINDHINNLEKKLGMSLNKFMGIHYSKEKKSLETVSGYIESKYKTSMSPATLGIYSKKRGIALKKPSSYIGNH
jgi:hypothetical protein